MPSATPLATLLLGKGFRPDDARGWENVLAEVPLFAELGSRQRRKVASLARIRRFADGAPIVRYGDPGDALHIVVDGAVSVLRPDRRPRTLGVGSVIGELALLDGGPRTATVTAKGELVTLTIPAAGFRKLLRSEPAIAVAIAEELARRLRAADS
ncbi:MAG TPA: cyclic nucleotide-binding domain-containing protein [Gaiellaceae bacterium]|jgi:CRP-like cAMP-binding protein|nr:cyclic nucleotide-binding domain-containing protein [Gaiellaceae bacterium]